MYAERRLAEAFQSARFFEAILPYLLAEAGPRAVRVDAVIAFELAAGDASRSWYADLRPGGEGWVEGTRTDADVTLTVEEHLVLPMITGALDLDTALGSGMLSVSGDLAALERFAGLFTESFRGLDTLIAGVRKDGGGGEG